MSNSDSSSSSSTSDSSSSNNTITRLDTAANNRYSEAVIHGDTIYLAGQVPSDASLGSISSQCVSVFNSIDELLARAGSSNRRILSAQVFLREMADAVQMNVEWERWMPNGCAPARITVGNVALGNVLWRIEVSIVAARNPSREVGE